MHMHKGLSHRTSNALSSAMYACTAYTHIKVSPHWLPQNDGPVLLCVCAYVAMFMCMQEDSKCVMALFQDSDTSDGNLLQVL